MCTSEIPKGLRLQQDERGNQWTSQMMMMMLMLMEIDVGASFSQVSSSSPFNGLVVMVEILWRRLWSGGATRIHRGGTDE
jgi:hypothetical protein